MKKKTKPQPQAPSERESTAYHEAGHAVAMTRFGICCGSVTIRRNGPVLGAAEGDGDWHDEEHARQFLTTHLAGYAVNVRQGAPEATARAYACADFEEAQREIAWLGITEREAIELAVAFVGVPENWHAIEVLAAELLKYETIDGQEIPVIVDIADGETTTAQLERYRLLARAGA